MGRILIIAPEEDVHARSVGLQLENSGHDYLIVDSSTFGVDNALSFHVNNDSSAQAAFGTIKLIGAVPNAVWLRRPKAPIPHSSIKQRDHADFAACAADLFRYAARLGGRALHD